MHATAGADRWRPSALFFGSEYAGHKTRFSTLRESVEADGRLAYQFRALTGWHDQGLVERLPVVPRAIRGRLRAFTEAAHYATFPRPDVVWTSARTETAPFAWAQFGPFHRPTVVDLDATGVQLESMAQGYFGRRPRSGIRARASRLQQSLAWKGATFFTPWSRWAADGLRSAGIDDSAIRVIPPGVDLAAWRPESASERGPDDPIRLLFVGGDFERKGGDMLLSLMASELGRSFTLDIVTREVIPAPGNTRVHTATPNSPELRRLFHRANLFVLPTRAECFGIAAVEAMAAGLPVAMTNIGGAGDIVEPGRTGWLIEPTTDALAELLRGVAADSRRLEQMGKQARQRAETRFDGRRNDTEVLDLLVCLAEEHSATARE